MTECFQIYKRAFIAGKKLVEIKQRSFNSYNISPLNKDKCIIQDGKLMLTADCPSVNFNQPGPARVLWEIAPNSAPVKISSLSATALTSIPA